MKFGKGCCNMRLFVASRITIYNVHISPEICYQFNVIKVSIVYKEDLSGGII